MSVLINERCLLWITAYWTFQTLIPFIFIKSVFGGLVTLKMKVTRFRPNGNQHAAVLSGLTFTALFPSSAFNLYDEAKTHQEELHSP